MLRLNKLVVLDVEGTIRYTIEDEKTQTIQYQNLESTFEKLKSVDCEIVLASNLESQEYVRLREQFKHLGIDQYISYYEPEEKPSSDGSDTKAHKIQKYIKEYAARGVAISPEQVHFYDDVEINVEIVKFEDYAHSYQVDNARIETSLLRQLMNLVHKLENVKPIE